MFGFGKKRVEKVQALTLEPGDVVVLSVPYDIDHSVAEGLRGELKRRFPDHENVVLSAGATLSKVSRERRKAKSWQERERNATPPPNRMPRPDIGDGRH